MVLYPVRGHQCVLNLEKFALNFAFSANIFTVSCIYFNGETADSLCVLSGAFD